MPKPWERDWGSPPEEGGDSAVAVSTADEPAGKPWEQPWADPAGEPAEPTAGPWDREWADVPDIGEETFMVQQPTIERNVPKYSEYVEPYKEGPITLPAPKDVVRAWEQGGAMMVADRAWFLANMGYGSYEDAQKMDKYMERLGDMAAGKEGLEKHLLRTTQILRPMIEGELEGAKIGTGAGFLMALVPGGQATIVPAFLGGQQLGAMQYWAQQGTGDLARRLHKAGVREEIARPIATVGGPVYAAIEFMNWNLRFLPGMDKLLGKPALKTVGNLAKRYAKMVAGETAEEGLQEFSQGAFTILGKLMDSKMEASKLPRAALDTIKGGVREMMEAVIPIALLGLPSATINAKEVVQYRKAVHDAEVKVNKIAGRVRKSVAAYMQKQQAKEAGLETAIDTDKAPDWLDKDGNVVVPAPETVQAAKDGDLAAAEHVIEFQAQEETRAKAEETKAKQAEAAGEEAIVESAQMTPFEKQPVFAEESPRKITATMDRKQAAEASRYDEEAIAYDNSSDVAGLAADRVHRQRIKEAMRDGKPYNQEAAKELGIEPPAPQQEPVPKAKKGRPKKIYEGPRNTPKQIDKMSMRDLRSLAKRAKWEDGTSVYDRAGKPRLKDDLADELKSHRAWYMQLEGREERKPPTKASRKKAAKTKQENLLKKEYEYYEELEKYERVRWEEAASEGLWFYEGEEFEMPGEDTFLGWVVEGPASWESGDMELYWYVRSEQTDERRRIRGSELATLLEVEEDAASDRQGEADTEEAPGMEPDEVREGGDEAAERGSEGEESLADWKKRQGLQETEQDEMFGKGAVGEEFKLKAEETETDVGEELEKQEAAELTKKQQGQLFEQRAEQADTEHAGKVRESQAALEKEISENAQDVQRKQKKKGEAGYVRVKAEKEEGRPRDRRVEEVLNARSESRNDVRGLFGRFKEWWNSIFVFKHNVRGYEKYRNEARKFKDAGMDASDKADQTIWGIIGNLDRKQYKQFRHIVALYDLVETAEQGRAVPLGISAEGFVAELEAMKETADPEVLAAVRKHFKMMDLIGEDLVLRGKLQETRDKYYPHKVLDYVPTWGEWVGGPKRMRESYRPYTKKRVGSEKKIDMDYIQVMRQHLGKVYLDNMVDDWMAAQMREWDIRPDLTDEQKQLLFGEDGRPVAGHIYEIDGKLYTGFQAQPGNAIYPASTINEQLFNMAVEANMTMEELMDLEGETGKALIRKAPVIGAPHRVYLLPSAIAEDLERFKAPTGALERTLRPLVTATGIWKRITLNTLMIPFQMRNMIGDLENLYKTDPAAFTKLAKALRLVLGVNLTEEDRQLLNEAHKQRVDTTHFLKEAGITAGPNVLAKFTSPVRRYNPVNIALDLWEGFSVGRERVARLAQFLQNMERLNQGKPIVAGEVDVTGLEPIDGAGKVAREFTVDYGAVTPEYSSLLRGLLTPFITFFDYNSRNWYKYAVKKPGSFMLKFGVPYAAMWVWNNTGDRREIEENVPEYYRYMPHVITGFKNKETGQPIIIAWETPLQLAAKWLGFERVADKITRVRSGDMTLQEAAKQQLVDMGLGAPRMVAAMLHPAMQMMRGYLTNRHPVFDSEIVPARLQGTEQGKRLMGEFMVSSVFVPYAQYMQASSVLEPGDTFQKYLMGGPFSWKRAFGIREVDLEKGRKTRIYETEADSMLQLREVLGRLEEGWAEWQTTGNRKKYAKAIEYLKKSPVKPTPEQMMNRLMGWRTLENVMKGRIRNADPDDPRLPEYRERLKWMQNNRFWIHQSKTPTAIRPETMRKAVEVYGDKQRR